MNIYELIYYISYFYVFTDVGVNTFFDIKSNISSDDKNVNIPEIDIVKNVLQKFWGSDNILKLFKSVERFRENLISICKSLENRIKKSEKEKNKVKISESEIDLYNFLTNNGTNPQIDDKSLLDMFTYLLNNNKKQMSRENFVKHSYLHDLQFTISKDNNQILYTLTPKKSFESNYIDYINKFIKGDTYPVLRLYIQGLFEMNESIKNIDFLEVAKSFMIVSKRIQTEKNKKPSDIIENIVKTGLGISVPTVLVISTPFLSFILDTVNKVETINDKTAVRTLKSMREENITSSGTPSIYSVQKTKGTTTSKSYKKDDDDEDYYSRTYKGAKGFTLDLKGTEIGKFLYEEIYEKVNQTPFGRLFSYLFKVSTALGKYIDVRFGSGYGADLIERLEDLKEDWKLNLSETSYSDLIKLRKEEARRKRLEQKSRQEEQESGKDEISEMYNEVKKKTGIFDKGGDISKKTEVKSQMDTERSVSESSDLKTYDKYKNVSDENKSPSDEKLEKIMKDIEYIKSHLEVISKMDLSQKTPVDVKTNVTNVFQQNEQPQEKDKDKDKNKDKENILKKIFESQNKLLESTKKMKVPIPKKSEVCDIKDQDKDKQKDDQQKESKVDNKVFQQQGEQVQSLSSIKSSLGDVINKNMREMINYQNKQQSVEKEKSPDVSNTGKKDKMSKNVFGATKKIQKSTKNIFDKARKLASKTGRNKYDKNQEQELKKEINIFASSTKELELKEREIRQQEKEAARKEAELNKKDEGEGFSLGSILKAMISVIAMILPLFFGIFGLMFLLKFVKKLFMPDVEYSSDFELGATQLDKEKRDKMKKSLNDRYDAIGGTKMAHGSSALLSEYAKLGAGNLPQGVVVEKSSKSLSPVNIESTSPQEKTTTTTETQRQQTPPVQQNTTQQPQQPSTEQVVSSLRTSQTDAKLEAALSAQAANYNAMAERMEQTVARIQQMENSKPDKPEEP